MKKKLLIGVGVVIALLIAAGIASVIYLDQQTEKQATKAENVRIQAKTVITTEYLLQQTNKARAENGVASLRLEPLLNQSAQYKLKDMVDRNYFNHKDPVTGKNNGLDYAESIGAPCKVWISENLAKNLANDPIYGFKTSSTHWQALIDARYESVGFAYNDKYLVQHLCDEH